MPYPFAHPAAVIPLARPLGRTGVPSALAIGSVVPDLWYFVPGFSRSDSHSAAGLVWFCIPAGLLAYALFHAVLKQPLVALISPRLSHYACAGLPQRPWYAVVVSLLVGAITHLVWDALTHAAQQGPNLWQHASTIVGAAILAVWVSRRLRAVPPAPAQLSAFARGCICLALLGAMAIAALWSADISLTADLIFDIRVLRRLLRTAGIGALAGLGAALLVYCLVFRRKIS